MIELVFDDAKQSIHVELSLEYWVLNATKSTHINELQAKLEISEKKNFELEAQLKELKLRLEFSESDARKNHVTEG